MKPPRALATDLDGTLIPLPDRPENLDALEVLRSARVAGGWPLVFVTGRHLELALDALREHALPRPDALIADVGTSLNEWDGGAWRPSPAYAERLAAVAPPAFFADLRGRLASVEGLRLQEPEKQGPFKLSYYCEASRVEELSARVREAGGDSASVIASVDPFTGDGLVDAVPAGASKALALACWCESEGLSLEEVVFCGDSGNDTAALTAGHRAVLVGNASPAVRQAVTAAAPADRLHIAAGHATSGVLEGCRKFGLLRE